MRVESIELHDFRNYRSERAAFVPGLNLIVGSNAQGKTNLLEGVHCLGGLGSPRAQDVALIREGADAAVLHGDVLRGQRRVRIDIELQRGRGARARLNGAAAPSYRALAEVFTSVYFGPDDLYLVKGSPDARRRFTDDLVVKLRPAKAKVRQEWERVLRQRNALLKSAPRRGNGASDARGTLEVWDEAFCHAGAALVAARLDALHRLGPHATTRYEEIAAAGRLDLGYVSAWMPPELSAGAATPDVEACYRALLAEVEKARPRELERGISLVGPQRDDVAVRLGKEPAEPFLDARTFASQGDQRTAALALKLAEHDLVAEALDDEPVLLLDDVFSELDPSRRAWLAKVVQTMGQTMVSSADDPGTLLPDVDRVLEIDAGRIHGSA